MASPDDFLEEEGERLIGDQVRKGTMDLEKVAKADNPQQEFMRQFAEAFGTKQGINLLQAIERRKYLMDILYNKEIVQSKIREVAEEKAGKLQKKERDIFWDKRLSEESKKQKELEKDIPKPFREIRKGKVFHRPKPFNWNKNFLTGEKTDKYNNFLLRNRDLPKRKIAWEFNQLFGAKQSAKSISDRLARLEGRRKGEKKYGRFS